MLPFLPSKFLAKKFVPFLHDRVYIHLILSPEEFFFSSQKLLKAFPLPDSWPLLSNVCPLETILLYQTTYYTQRNLATFGGKTEHKSTACPLLHSY